MLTLPHRPARLCDGLSRRDWLTIGGLGAFGLTLPGLLRAAESPRPKKAKNVILLFLLGGPPQHETWDPKPDAPAEIRGDHGTIPTATPGLRIGETMAMTDRIAVLRAVETRDNAHSSSGYFLSTGVPHAPMSVENVRPAAPNDHPTIGAVARKFLPEVGGLPAAITLPEQAANDGNITWPGQDAGFLGRKFDPWLLTGDPSADLFRPEGMTPRADVPPNRLADRQALLARFDTAFAKLDSQASEHTARTQQAIDLIGSPAAKKAFDLNGESPKLRDRYGRTRFGQSCLLARRLIESGVRLVRVNWTRVDGAPNNGHWDTHASNSAGVKALMPVLDAAYTTLLDDLADRGLLDDTLVIWMGEMGRTPKLNGAGGRDHWGQVMSVALAGGGVRGGAVYGTSDKAAGYPIDGRVRPDDLTATIFHTLGIPPDAELHDTFARPIPATRGQPIRQLF
ncbi:MAG: DUF1501 domain-containing protein [Fimbriiglobus sp.]|nr:DUF1501 domain-containing protein [Fimbriiglobus sp.]